MDLTANYERRAYEAAVLRDSRLTDAEQWAVWDAEDELVARYDEFELDLA